MHTAQLFATGAKRIKSWVRSWFNNKPEPPKSQIFQVNTSAMVEPDEDDRHTKAYADQRQKAIHNQHRKPSKAMRNLYQLQRN